MKKNKTLMEVGLIVLLIVILSIPIFIFANNNNKTKGYDKLIDNIKSAAINYGSNDSKIKIGKLKENNLLDKILVNPKTGRPISNESYVSISKNEYNVNLYDIPKDEDVAGLIVNFNGDKNMQNGIGARYNELGISLLDGSEYIDYSIQYFLKGKEVSNIDTSRPKNYDVVYTALTKSGEIAKVVRSVVVQ